ncbi:MAG: AAA family ATPase, partial [candidate division NC10 bacterium]
MEATLSISSSSAFLRQLLDERREAGPAERAVYLSFDDDRLAGLELEQLGFLLEEYYRRHPALRGRETVYWFLDEIQLVPGWERFVRRVLDSEKAEIAVSGSSARMLSREVHTSLRGRGMATVIRPFSFREFLRHRGEEPRNEPRRWTPAERSLIEKRFREYLVEGGFPEAQGVPAATNAATHVAAAVRAPAGEPATNAPLLYIWRGALYGFIDYTGKEVVEPL